MKKFFYFPLLVAVLVLSSCCKTVPNYTKLIPEEADVVIRLDIRQMSKKSGLTGNDKMMKKAEEFIKSEFTGKVREKMLAIFNDPAEAGLDLRDPVFLYFVSGPENNFGIVGAIWKADRFTELLNVLAGEMGTEKVHTGDINYVRLSNVMLCYNDDWFCFTPTDEEVDAKAQAQAIVKRYESDSKSIADNAGFRKMCEKRGLAQVFIKGETIGTALDGIMGYMYDNNPDFASFYEEESAFGEMEEIADSVVIPDDADVAEKDVAEEEEVAEEEDAMFTEPMEPDNDNYRSSASELAKKMGYDLEKVGVILEFSMKNGEAAFTSEIVPFDNETQKALKAIDKELGGKQEGFCLRVNFGALKQFAKIADNLSSDDVLFMQMAANFVKYIELKYEGNCMVSLRMKTHDQSKTPVQSLVEMVSNYLDFI